MPIGKWLVLKGYEPKPGANKAAQNSLPPRQVPAPTPPPQEIKPPKEEKAPKEEKPFEPWLDTLKGDFKPIQVSTCYFLLPLALSLVAESLWSNSCDLLELAATWPSQGLAIYHRSSGKALRALARAIQAHLFVGFPSCGKRPEKCTW